MVKRVRSDLRALLANAQEEGLVARNVVREVRSNRRRGKERQAERPARPEEPHVQGRIDGHPGVALRDLEASRAALSRSKYYQPQPKERRLSCSRPSDISNWPKS